jgi:hypothetical protein
MNDDTALPDEFELTIRIMGGQAVVISAPGDMCLQDMVVEFVEAVNLPGHSADGSLAVWRLDDKLAGRRCDLTQTVADVCTRKKNVEFFLTRSVVAG